MIWNSHSGVTITRAVSWCCKVSKKIARSCSAAIQRRQRTTPSSKRRATRTSYFLLLEVLLALSLVTLCALPLLRPHFDLAKHWAKSARLLKENLEADQAFQRVRLMFLDDEITWKELDRKRKVSKEIGPFHVVVQEKEKSKKNFRLVNVDVTIGKHDYHYELYLARETPRPAS